MNLREFVRDQIQTIFDALRAGNPPPVGEYDPAPLRECQRRATPQVGATRFMPDAIVLEFIFQDASLGPAVLSVRVPAPEPIVYMPVPDWVIEDVWQGDVTGSFRFRSEAERLLEAFQKQVFTEQNRAYFEKSDLPKRRD
ncbi:MAG: hypothetical protein KatS3mg019_1819 [Fimbriimonadales bacterium]|nr:MAG: hypothetical protein KatS3mg019_1819 [Fimbriimonadales bacterium]